MDNDNLSFDEFRARLKARSEIRTPSGACPVGVALKVFRGRWKADVLYRLCAGPSDFGALLRALAPEGLTRTMLASTLRELEKDGVAAPSERYEGRVRRVDWALTHAGEDLLPVFHALMLWGSATNPADAPGYSERNRPQFQNPHSFIWTARSEPRHRLCSAIGGAYSPFSTALDCSRQNRAFLAIV